MTTETVAALPQEQPATPAVATEVEQDKPTGQEEQPEQAPTTEADEPPKQPKGVQKRLDELRRQAGDAQRMNERLLSLMEKALLKGEAPRVDTPQGPPRREDFQDYESYLEARSDWQLSEKMKELASKVEAEKRQQAVAQREATWEQKQAEASKKYEDFAEVALADDLTITPIMAEAMKDSDLGPDVAYYLGKNPSEAERIARLSPAAQVREIGKIEARLESKPEPVRKPSKAPAPIEPVGSGSPSTTDPAKMSQADYEAWRAKQGAWWAPRK